MTQNLRKLVTVRKIDSIAPIVGADAIEVATIEGWEVVVKRGEFAVNQQVVYIECDSFLPDGNPAWQFLVDKHPRTFEGKLGHRLRIVKLRGTTSQGLVLNLNQVPQITNTDRNVDQSDFLGIVKWEQPLPACLAGQAEGLFPGWIRKTEQERAENLVSEIFHNDTLNDNTNLDALFEITMKLDGSSCTMFHRDGEVGVCSRNLQLKVNEENASNTFVNMLVESGLQAALPQLGNIAIQGELMGPSIQGNREQFKAFRFYIFDVQNLDTGKYLTPLARIELMEDLRRLGVKVGDKVFHVPVWTTGGFKASPTVNDTDGWTLQQLGIKDIKSMLAFADGPSITHQVREGVVFKRFDGNFSFKAISQKFLLKEAD